jgi:hypothetical protein
MLMKPLRIVLDNKSLKLLENEQVLKYSSEKKLEFIDLEPNENLASAELVYDSLNEPTYMQVRKDRVIGEYGFGWNTYTINQLVEGLGIKQEDLLVLLKYISLTEFSDAESILITERKKLLNRRHWGRTFTDVPHNRVMHPVEARKFIDLYFKQNKVYYITPHFTSDAIWILYLYAMKTRIKNFQLPWSISVFMEESKDKTKLMSLMQSLGDRVTDMLRAIDKIGVTYYFDKGNDQQDRLIYHLNYWVLLYAGVLDNLALITDFRYGIAYPDPIKIGLRKDTSKDFLSLVRQHNSHLITFIEAQTHVINMVSETRNGIAHAVRLQGLSYDNRNESFKLNMVKISREFFQNIQAVSAEDGKILRSWGIYRDKFGKENWYYLEPSRFVTMATQSLCAFIDEYLKKLDFEDYMAHITGLEEKIRSNKTASLQKELDVYKSHGLGF